MPKMKKWNFKFWKKAPNGDREDAAAKVETSSGLESAENAVAVDSSAAVGQQVGVNNLEDNAANTTAVEPRVSNLEPVATCVKTNSVSATMSSLPPAIKLDGNYGENTGEEDSDIEGRSSMVLSAAGSASNIDEKRRRFSDRGTQDHQSEDGSDSQKRLPQTMSLELNRTNTFPRATKDPHLLPGQQNVRRGSFIFRQGSKTSTHSTSSDHTMVVVSDNVSEVNGLITPFNQTHQSLKQSIARLDSAGKGLQVLFQSDDSLQDAGRDPLAHYIDEIMGVLTNLKVCDKELEEMSKEDRTVGQFAANKFSHMLTEEVRESPNVAAWISDMFTGNKSMQRVAQDTPMRMRGHSIAGMHHNQHHKMRDGGGGPLSPPLQHSMSMPGRQLRMTSILEPTRESPHTPRESPLVTGSQSAPGVLTSPLKHMPTLPAIDSASDTSSQGEQNTGGSDVQEQDEGQDQTDGMLNSVDIEASFIFPGTSHCSDLERFEELMKPLNTWQFDIFEVEKVTFGRPFVPVVLALLKERDLLSALRIEEPDMANYLGEIEMKYNKNPYHNSWHGADVAQTADVLIRQAGLERYLTPSETFGVILSAAVHDVGHPGVNNDFLIKTRDELALLYNDESVLENMHASTAIRLAEDSNKECQIFKNLTSGEYDDVRSRIIKMILATDPKKHMTMLGMFTSFIEGIKVKCVHTDGSFEDDFAACAPVNMKPADKSLMLESLLHSADISNPCKPHHITMAWTERIVTEFHNQGDREKEEDLVPLAVFDRASKQQLHDTQIGFIKGIVQPQWEAWDLFTKSVGQEFEDPLDCLNITFAHWEKLKSEHEAAKKAESSV